MVAMERNTQRINGVSTRLHRLSEGEIESMMGFAHERIDAAAGDLEALGIESARRFAAGEALGPLATVHQLHPGQLELPDTTPPAAA